VPRPPARRGPARHRAARPRLFEYTSATGSLAGTTVSAIAGIDIALHDPAGKLEDQPASQLLGGTFRDAPRVYVDCHAGAHLGGAHDPADRDAHDVDIYAPESYADAAEMVVDEGFDAIKFDLDASKRYEKDRHNRHLNAEAIDYKASVIEAVTERVGHDADVAFDCHWNYAGESATKLAPGCRGLRRLVARGRRPAGEPRRPARGHQSVGDVHLRRRESLPHPRRPTAHRGTGRRRPPAGHAQVRRDVRNGPGRLERLGLLHPRRAPQRLLPLGTVASAHVGATIPNFLALEWHGRDDPDWPEFVEEDTIIEDGGVPLSDDPGPGVTLDLDTVAEFMADGETLLDEE